LSLFMFVRAHALDVVPVSKVPDACAAYRACSRHCSFHLAYPHIILYT
jgi:hypothetical protein